MTGSVGLPNRSGLTPVPLYGVAVASGRVDLFVTYCSNVRAALVEQPGLVSVDLPAAINVVAEYGIAVRNKAPVAARAFADYLLSPAGQAILLRHGFGPPA